MCTLLILGCKSETIPSPFIQIEQESTIINRTLKCSSGTYDISDMDLSMVEERIYIKWVEENCTISVTEITIGTISRR